MSVSFTYKNAPRWFILLSDVIICLASLIISYLLRFDFDLSELDAVSNWVASLVALSLHEVQTNKIKQMIKDIFKLRFPK